MRVSTRLWCTVNISRFLMTEYDKNFLEWYKDPEEKKKHRAFWIFPSCFRRLMCSMKHTTVTLMPRVISIILKYQFTTISFS